MILQDALTEQLTELAHINDVSVDGMLQILIDTYRHANSAEKHSHTIVSSTKPSLLDIARAHQNGLFEQSNDAIFLFDLNGNNIDVNQRAMDLLGYTYDELVNLSIRDTVKDEELQLTLDIKARLLNGDKIPIYERTLLHKDGSEVPVEVNVACVFSDDDQPLYIQAINRDIRERKRLLQEIQYSELRYRTILETMAEGVIVYDTNGDPQIANPAAEDLLGVSLNRMRGSAVSPSRRVIKQDGTSFAHADLPLNISLREGVAVFGTIMGVEQPDDLLTWLSVNSVPIKNEHNEITDVIVTFSDFTRVMNAQKQALKLAIERERVHVITDFVQNSSHEFRTPLSIIQTSTYFLNKQQSDNPQTQKRVTEINIQVKRITQLVDTLLLMAKLDSISRMQPNLRVNLSMLLSDIVLVQSNKITTHQIKLSIDDSTKHLTMPSLSNYLVQGLEAVLDNAIQYSPENSEINIALTNTKNTVRISIEDHGIGIANEDIPHIFTRFWRKDSAHTNEGLGLGLSIAQRVVELHQGHIEVDSQLNEGTCITIVLPKYDN